MGIGSLLSTALINKYGTKACLVLGGLGNVQWILSSILAAQFGELKELDETATPHPLIAPCILLSTCLNGLTVGILWASANSFVA